MANQKLGEYAFLVGVAVAVLASVAAVAGVLAGPNAGMVSALLVVLGVAVGLLNISDKESQPFLLATVALLVAGTASFAPVPQVGSLLDSMVKNLSVLVAPAAVILAVKATWAMASGK